MTAKTALATVLLPVLALGLAGCASVLDLEPTSPRPPGPGERALSSALEAKQHEPAGLPPAVEGALLPPLHREDHSDDDEPRFDVSVNNAPARDFFMSLVADTDMNMVVDPAMKGVVSLSLRSVTLREVLNAVRDVYGYEYEVLPGGFYVQPPRMQVRIYELDYLNVRREGHSQTRVSSGQVSEQTRSDDGISRSGADSEVVVSGSLIQTESQADLWVDIHNTLGQIVGDEDGRRVVTNPNSGIIVVRAMPGELRDVENYLSSVESSLQRQVILEAKIIEVTLEDGFRSGINWSRLSTLGSKTTRVIATQTGGGTLLDNTMLSEIAGNSGTLDPRSATLPAGDDTSAFGGIFTLAVEDDKFSTFLELLEDQGEVQVLSSPRISTLNNQKAVIKVGSDEFFVTEVSTTTVSGTTTTTNPSIELTPFFSGIALDVTPRIDEDGSITLHIHPSVSEVRDQIKVISIGSEAQSLPLALSTIRETDSIVRARSNQIVVIGGLMQDNAADLRAGVPWISHIPFFGRLFEHRLSATLKKELVILLRPVLVDRETWTTEIQHSSDNLSRMRGEKPDTRKR